MTKAQLVEKCRDLIRDLEEIVEAAEKLDDGGARPGARGRPKKKTASKKRPARKAASKKKPAARKKKASKRRSDDEPDVDDVRKALMDVFHAEGLGQRAVDRILRDFDVKRVPDLDEDDYARVIEAAQNLLAEEGDEEEENDDAEEEEDDEEEDDEEEDDEEEEEYDDED